MTTSAPEAAPIALAIATPAPVVPPPAPAASPLTPAAPPVAVVAPPQVPSLDQEPEDGKGPSWLAKRLEREREKVLRDLGVDKAEDAKAAIAAHRAKLEADKTELQKAQEAAARVAPLTAEVATYRSALGDYATGELAKLTPEQRSAVSAVAGEDPAVQLRTLAALRPTWVVAPPATPPAPAAPLPIPPPANTAPAPAAPPHNPPPAVDHLAIFEELNKYNPIGAANFYEANKGSIEAAKKARATQ